MIDNILDLLFNIFIYPIEYIMKSIIDSVFYITNSYGISIIVLSIVINIILIPLFYLAEKIKNDNQKIIDKLQPRIDDLKRNYKKPILNFYIKALYRTNNYHPINGLKASFGLLLQIPFFIAAFHFIGNYEVFNQASFGIIDDLGQPDGLLFGLNILPIIMISINLLSIYAHSNDLNKSDKHQLLGMSFIFLVFLYLESSALLLYWSMNNLFILIRSQIEKHLQLDNFKNKTASLLISLFIIPIYKIKQNKIFNFIIKDIYIQAIILFFGTIFIYKAIPMAASDTGMYLASYSLVAFTLIGFFFICIFISYFIYYFLPRIIKYIITILAVFGALSGLYFGFIDPFELGTMRTLAIPTIDEFRVIDSTRINRIMSVVFILTSIVLLFISFKKIKKALLIVLLFSNTILLSYTFLTGINPKTIHAMLGEDDLSFGSFKVDENKLKEAYSFSKESNVVVVLMDAFQGNIFYDILEKYPEFKSQLSGFTYYPNTLSAGSETLISLSAIIGGEEYLYLDKRVNHKDAILKSMAMAEKYNHSYFRYSPKSLDGRCNLPIYDKSICLDTFEVNTKSSISSSIMENIDNQHKKTTNNTLTTSTIFARISFLLTMPHDLKVNIISKINFSGIFKDEFLENYLYNLAQYFQLSNMSDFANANSDKKTFKIVHNMLTHRSRMMNEKCEIIEKDIIGYYGLFNSAQCSIRLLINFFDKLKELNIYDQTKIIIISDHGNSGFIRIDSKFIPIPRKKTYSSALMLVKDFNEKGDIKISNKFLSNMDTYGIALSGISNNNETKLDPIKNDKKNRILIHVDGVDHKLRSLNIFKVRESIFDEKNWEKVDKK